MSIVIVGVMFVAAVSTLGAAAGARTVQADIRKADSLARALMAEVAQCKYGSTGGSIVAVRVLGAEGVGRLTWDTLDDYHGLTESPPAARDGVKLAGYTGWARSVNVERVDPADPGGASTRSTDRGLKRITVSVRSPSGKTATLVSLRSRWGVADAELAPGEARAQSLTLRLRVHNGPDLWAGTLVPNGIIGSAADAEGALIETEVGAAGTEGDGLLGIVGGVLGDLLGGGK